MKAKKLLSFLLVAVLTLAFFSMSGFAAGTFTSASLDKSSIPYAATSTDRDVVVTITGTSLDTSFAVSLDSSGTSPETITLSSGDTEGKATLSIPANSTASDVPYTVYYSSDGSSAWTTTGQTVTAVAASNDATLKSLTYTGGGANTAVPSFQPMTDTYSVTLPYGTTGIASITGAVNDPNAQQNTSGSSITLNASGGTAKIVVTAEDGSTKRTYTVNFTFAPASALDSITATAAGSTIKAAGETVTVAIAGTNLDTSKVKVSAFQGGAVAPTVSSTGTITNATGGNLSVAIPQNNTANTISWEFKVSLDGTNYVVSSSDTLTQDAAPTAAALSVTPDTIDFGTVVEGYSVAPSQKSIAVKNTGGTDFTNLAIALSNDSKFTTGGGPLSATLAAGATTTLTFQPNTGWTAGTYNETITFTATGMTNVVIPVKFVVEEATTILSATPSPVTFTSLINAVSLPGTKTITISNNGNTALTSAVVTLSGGNAASFTIADSPVTVAANGGTDTFTVVPAAGTVVNAAKTYTSTIVIENGDDDLSIPVSFTVIDDGDIVSVTNITGIPTTTTVGTLNLSGTVVPDDATNKAIIWSEKTDTSNIASLGGSTLTTTGAGEVIVTATIVDGKFSLDTETFSNYTKTFDIVVTASSGGGNPPPAGAFVPVTDITGVAGVQAVGSFNLSGTVTPANATNKTIQWDILSAGTTGATMDSATVVKTTAPGTLVMRATVANGATATTAFTKDFTIEIYNGGTTPPTDVTPPSSGGSSNDDDDNDDFYNADNMQGGGGGGGSSYTPPVSGATSSTASSNVAADGTVSHNAVATDAREAIADSVGTTANIVVRNAKEVTPETLENLANIATNNGKTLTLMADTTNGNAVEGRLYVEPAKLANLNTELLLGVSTTNAAAETAETIFEQWFANDVAVVSCAQQGTFGAELQIAAKVDLAGLDTTTLIFYSYNKATNSYARIAAPRYYVDANGYLHFFTTLAGDIIITDAPLSK